MVHFVGDAGANFHPGAMFRDTLDGQGGNDTLNGQESNDSVLGGDGDDSLAGGDGKDTLLGGLDGDVLSDTGDDDADLLDGGDGNDTVFGSRRDNIQGGAGTDYLGLYLSDAFGRNVDLSSLTSGGSITFAGTTLGGFETGFIQFGAGDDKVVAPAMDLLIHGGLGNDTLLGGAGGDELDGGAGQTNDADVVRGGLGDDLVLGGVGDILDGGDGTSDNFELYLGDSTVGFDADFSPLAGGGAAFVGLGTRVVRCERGMAQFGSGDDRVEVGTLAGGLTIVIFAHDGNDTLIGGDNNDNLGPGAGNDVVRGGAGFDAVNYQNMAGPIVVDLNITTWQDTGGAGIDRLIAIERVNGSSGDDRLMGDAEDNLFQGYNGNDTLLGGPGSDALFGGSGGFDPLTDVDLLAGGMGQDTYNGGAGDDVLVWSSTSQTTIVAPDLIQGLEAGDVIDLGAIDADTTTPGDQAFTIVDHFSATPGELAMIFDAGKTYFRMDTDGDDGADGVIEATGDHTSHTEFVL